MTDRRDFIRIAAGTAGKRKTLFQMIFIGAALLAVTTSLPELVASIASLRIGAYDMAVGNLFGHGHCAQPGGKGFMG